MSSTMGKIYYKGGYKYQLTRGVVVQVGIKPSKNITTEYIDLTRNGSLVIRKGYCWDGPSGPAIDTKNFMRGSLVHDAAYQLIRQGYLPAFARKLADRELHRIILEDGMSRIRAWLVLRAVSRYAGPAADPSNRKAEMVAP